MPSQRLKASRSVLSPELAHTVTCLVSTEISRTSEPRRFPCLLTCQRLQLVRGLGVRFTHSLRRRLEVQLHFAKPLAHPTADALFGTFVTLPYFCTRFTSDKACHHYLAQLWC